MDQLTLFDAAGKSAVKINNPDIKNAFQLLERFGRDFDLKLSTGTVRIYNHHLTRLFRYLIGLNISPLEAKPAELKEYLTTRFTEPRGRDPKVALSGPGGAELINEKTRGVAISAFRTFYSWAGDPDQGYCKANPAMKLTFPDKKQRLPNILRKRNYEFIKGQEAANPLVTCLLILFAEAGLKTGEVLAITLNDITDLKGGFYSISIQKESTPGIVRNITVDSAFTTAFQKLLAEKGVSLENTADAYAQIFNLHPTHGAQAINRVFYEINEKYGMKNLEAMPKNLRHYYHRGLLDVTPDYNEISEKLGLAPYNKKDASFDWDQFKKLPR